MANTLSPAPLGIYRKKWEITNTETIATAGSCFAQHIGRNLKERGFQVADFEPAPWGLPPERQAEFGFSMYSARYGNIYTTRQLLQLAKEAHGIWRPAETTWQRDDGTYVDCMRPGVEPAGLRTEEEVTAHRTYHLERVRSLFSAMDVFIFTMGLTETWIHRETGTVFPTAPGTIAGRYDAARYGFKNLSFREVLDDFLEFRELVRDRRVIGKRPRFLLTVSPVPLTATASGQHVLLATVHSKSILRAVAGELASTLDDVDYFPSYEIVSNSWSPEDMYESNRRSVRSSAVETVMETFFASHGSGPSLATSEVGTLAGERNQSAAESSADNVICEESILDAFAEKKDPG